MTPSTAAKTSHFRTGSGDSAYFLYLVDHISTGYILQLGGIAKYLAAVVNFTPRKFVIMYSLGNLLSMSASMFLFTPKTMWKNMMNPTRKTVTIVFFSSLTVSVLTCLLVDTKMGKIVTLISAAVQMGSYWWYTLSYIPFARAMIKKCCSCLYDGLDNL